MMSERDWTHTNHWWLRGDRFLIEVATFPGDQIGPNRWNVYAYIYPGHSWLEEFHGGRICQPATTALPLHNGPSYLKYHHDEYGDLRSIQVGSDYSHDSDGRFGHASTPEDAWEVFRDAEELYDFLDSESKR